MRRWRSAAPHTALAAGLTVALSAAALTCDGPTFSEPDSDPLEPAFAANPAANPTVKRVVGIVQQYVSPPQRRSFSFDATERADGTVEGSWQINNLYSDAHFDGYVTCVTVVGNQAWVGGVTAEGGENGFAPGTEVGFWAEDNGQGGNADLDRLSLLYPLGSPHAWDTAEDWCQDMPTACPTCQIPLELTDIASGSIRIDCVGEDCVAACAAAPEPADEICNGLDDDLDRLADEDFADLGTLCSVEEGVCFAYGTRVCNASGTGTICNADLLDPNQLDPNYEAIETACDGLDNDCDGSVDEGCAPSADTDLIVSFTSSTDWELGGCSFYPDWNSITLIFTAQNLGSDSPNSPVSYSYPGIADHGQFSWGQDAFGVGVNSFPAEICISGAWQNFNDSFTVIIDSRGEIPETNEDNNTTTVTFLDGEVLP